MAGVAGIKVAHIPVNVARSTVNLAAPVGSVLLCARQQYQEHFKFEL